MCKKIIAIFLILTALGFVIMGSRGALDERGGHNCYTQCEKWGLYQGEYHVHIQD